MPNLAQIYQQAIDPTKKKSLQEVAQEKQQTESEIQANRDAWAQWIGDYYTQKFIVMLNDARNQLLEKAEDNLLALTKAEVKDIVVECKTIKKVLQSMVDGNYLNK